MPSSTTNSKPVATVSLGGVHCGIFANKIKDRIVYKTALKRSYVKDGEIKSVTSLFVNDLPRAAVVLQRAYEKIFELQRADRQKSKGDSENSETDLLEEDLQE